MEQTTWTGPKGTAITISTGSSQPPRWALLLIDRVVASEGRRRVRVKWLNCRRGCPHGRAYPWSAKTVLYTTGSRVSDTPLILHELAHLYAGDNGHGERFYRALVRIAHREGKVRAVSTFQNNKAAIRRAKRSLGLLPQAA